MYRPLIFMLAIMFCFASVAQQKNPPTHPTRPEKPASKEPSVPQFSTRLPSEDTVNEFFQQMFGYDSTVSWKIVEIRPSQAEGLSEVLVQISNAFVAFGRGDKLSLAQFRRALCVHLGQLQPGFGVGQVRFRLMQSRTIRGGI